MNELLSKLLQQDFLTEEVRVELQEAFNQHIAEAVSQARETAIADTRAELYTKYLTEQETLVEALDMQVRTMVAEEISALKEELERFRDLDAEYATRLVEARADLNEQIRGDMRDLLVTLNSFLEDRFVAEMSSLKESIDDARKCEFGRKIFETFGAQFSEHFVSTTEDAVKLREAREEIASLESRLQSTNKRLKQVTRESEMQRVLAPLAGKTRSVMESLLENIPTEKLEENYRMYLGRVLREAEQPSSIDESAATTVNTVVKTGDNKIVVESHNTINSTKSTQKLIDSLRDLAGITNP